MPTTINDERISERMSTISRDTIDVITFSSSLFFIDYFSGTRPFCRYIRHDMSASGNSRIATTRQEAVDNDGNDYFYRCQLSSNYSLADHQCPTRVRTFTSYCVLTRAYRFQTYENNIAEEQKEGCA